MHLANIYSILPAIHCSGRVILDYTCALVIRKIMMGKEGYHQRKEGLYLTDALRQWEKVYPTWPFPFPPKRMVPK